MLRTVMRHVEGNLVNSNICASSLKPVYYQTIRWRRKPRWLPTARSKIFRVPERKKLPLEEHEELKRLFNNYRTEMKSIREYFAAQNQDTSSTAESEVVEAEEYGEEHRKCFVLNDQWNAEVKQLREETLAKEKELELEEILKSIEETRMKMVQKQQQIEEIVRLEKERAKSYITAQNIDEALEKAFENQVDYNYAIDLKGNFYHGKNTKPPKMPSTSPEVQQQEATA